MNIGIDFNTKITKAVILGNGSNINDFIIFETKNILVFSNGNIFAGNEGFNKFLAEKDSTVYELVQIIELNGLIINKSQISAEKCLSVIFSNLLDKIKMHTQSNEVACICVSIPYDRYYYWNGLMKRAFSLIGIEKVDVRVISQPAAFFCQPNINLFLRNINPENLRIEQHRKYLYSQAVKKHEESPWYKKLFSKIPEFRNESKNDGYLFISISQDSTNVSLVEYGYDVLLVVSTQYTNSVTRRIIEHSVLDYFVLEISKDSRKFAVKDQKTLVRISETVKEFLKTPHTGKYYELNLPYILCEDGEYRTLDIPINLDILHNFLAPILDNLAETMKQLAQKIQEAQNGIKMEFQTKIDTIIVVGDLYIQQNIKEILSKYCGNFKVAYGTGNSLATGAFNFSRILTGEKKNFIALEVIPFSVLIRLRGGEFVEMIKKDTAIPTKSKECSFEIIGESKSKFVEIHLTTKEGDTFQSLNVWKIDAPTTRIINITVDIDAHMIISMNAHSDNGQKLAAQMGNTFSFSGAGFEVGIKGQDIRQYILNQFNYLTAVLDIKEARIFEPDETFYAMLKDGDPFKALRYIGYFLKLKSLPDVEMVVSKNFEEQGIAGFISGSKISIPKYFTKDPYGFGYVLAHELAHYILIHEEQIMLDDEQENEILTEIYVIYSGMGKLFLNGFKSKDVESSSIHERGYLDEEILKYIHEIYFSRFNMKLAGYRKNLTNYARKMLDELVNS